MERATSVASDLGPTVASGFDPTMASGFSPTSVASGFSRTSDRGRESVRSPSLRTGRAGLPHPALQLVGHLIED